MQHREIPFESPDLFLVGRQPEDRQTLASALGRRREHRALVVDERDDSRRGVVADQEPTAAELHVTIEALLAVDKRNLPLRFALRAIEAHFRGMITLVEHRDRSIGRAGQSLEAAEELSVWSPIGFEHDLPVDSVSAQKNALATGFADGPPLLRVSIERQALPAERDATDAFSIGGERQIAVVEPTRLDVDRAVGGCLDRSDRVLTFEVFRAWNTKGTEVSVDVEQVHGMGALVRER